MKIEAVVKFGKLAKSVLWFRYLGNRSELNGNNRNLNYNNRARGIAHKPGHPIMKTYNNIYSEIYSLKNLILAWKKARKHKTKKDYVIEFERNLKENILNL